MSITKEKLLSSPAFLEIAGLDALKLIAKKNNQTFKLTAKAFVMQVPNVIKQFNELVEYAA
ncbi:MAG: hypothetical protein IBX55_12935 [Methyloprofundus sp.]|nr:hypothetical protein [Methyloprofundus sp.]